MDTAHPHTQSRFFFLKHRSQTPLIHKESKLSQSFQPRSRRDLITGKGKGKKKKTNEAPSCNRAYFHFKVTGSEQHREKAKKKKKKNSFFFFFNVNILCIRCRVSDVCTGTWKNLGKKAPEAEMQLPLPLLKHHRHGETFSIHFVNTYTAKMLPELRG